MSNCRRESSIIWSAAMGDDLMAWEGTGGEGVGGGLLVRNLEQLLNEFSFCNIR